jgi:hypothetical protein
MLGERPKIPPPPSFWSDQYGLRIQYVGDAAVADGVAIDGDPATNDFSVLYTRGEHLVAALTVGRPREFQSLRRRIDAEEAASTAEIETQEIAR